MTLKLVPWSIHYAEWLQHAITEFFRASLARGADILPTARNVDLYLNIGLRGADAGDPCLLALANDKPVAYVMWVGVPDVLDSTHKSVNAIGSYTDPAWRSKTIAAALREEALRIVRAKGYTKVVGPVQNSNPRGLQEFCVAYGAWPVSTNFELLL